jgi:hypothetical protein
MNLRPAFLARYSTILCLGMLAAAVASCSRDSIIAPSRIAGSSGPSLGKSPTALAVTSTNPPFGDQGTTIDVHILGSGFTSGAQATWLLHGNADPAHVRTNTTTFISSTELVANITIASDAQLAFWDVQVALIGGKNGVGSECFEVTSAQVLSSRSVNIVYRMNNLLQVVGYYNGDEAFVIDEASRFVDLGSGQAWGLDPDGSIAVGRNGNQQGAAWVRQADGSWTTEALPPAPNSVEQNATSAARTASGTLLVAGWDGTPGLKHGEAFNRPVVWQRAGSSWSNPVVYAYPSGAQSASARTVNGLGQIAGNVDASGVGAVWDNPATPTRLDGLPDAINSSGTLIVGSRPAGSTTIPVYWWRNSVTGLWNTTGVPLPMSPDAKCNAGEARGLNDAGVIVGYSCNAAGRNQATVWLLDLSGVSPSLVGTPTLLPGLGVKNPSTNDLSSAAGVNQSPPYVVAGSAISSNNQRLPVRWQLR